MRGPDLLGKAGAAGACIDGQGILSQLEHGVAAPAAKPALRWRPGWRHGAAGALGLAVLLTTVLAYDTDVLPLPPVPAKAMAPPAMPAPTLLPHTEQAATIVNTAGPPLPEVAAVSVSPKRPPPVRQAAARPQGTRPAAAPGDSDVALLTAMVAHAHRQEGPAKPVRDVVLRKQEEETAELLQRCQQLGLIEGMLCRSRICSGRWDSDPACH
ncbi:hypothetical protein VM94_04684 [Janthinobacterium sp. KBS0711]|uniref:hypothetical protein n=1 Tax=Janthinobacterium sp. KBS0711 TaxID=1649647 RepID=UPI000627FED3|nr:hypothetical protein [Janthinobacterium sp. KBS0711]KKO60917.1 hypothetical protein VM94_04684 [Janthinobacterium sp. KBS0711]TSD73190.1 hypothetical protein FFI39_020690 [Janthinobacterium sp. KBS0711]